MREPLQHSCFDIIIIMALTTQMLLQSENDKHERARGYIQLAGAVISPSDEDSHTFTVSPAVGESYKLRAVDTKDRQMWINRLRVVAEMHTRAIAHNNPPLAPREHRTRDTQQQGAGAAAPPAMGLAVLDAFTQVAEVLEEARNHHTALAHAIEELPSYGAGMRCIDPNLLLLKATSQATLICLDQCLGVLKSQQMATPLPLASTPQAHSATITTTTTTSTTTTMSPPSAIQRVSSLTRASPRSSPLLSRSPRFHRRAASDAATALPKRRSSPTAYLFKFNIMNFEKQMNRSSLRWFSHAGKVKGDSARSGSPSLHRSSSPSVRSRTAPHSPANHSTVTTVASSPASVPATDTNNHVATPSTQPLNHVAAINVSTMSLPSSVMASTTATAPSAPPSTTTKVPADTDSEVSDPEDGALESDLGHVEEGQKSVIMHIISQLRLGMDLTRVTLPTFILEKRSLLEMFADFLGHPDYFIRIADCQSGEDRIMSVVKWYLTSIHVGRNGSVAKKPYNPIIGETFYCTWRVPRGSSMEQGGSGKEQGEDSDPPVLIKFRAEQVSHHPPVSAFFIECPEKQLCINAHIWTKSKFMGMSVGVNLIGDITLSMGKQREAYTLAMPSAYARSILTEPWVELGGRVNIACAETGCQAAIIFHTKPFYGGKLHRVTAEVKNASSNVLCRVQGEWDSVLEFQYTNGESYNLDVQQIPFVCRKRVKPLAMQAPFESRRLWHDVTVALGRGDVETATNHKRALEETQRTEERERAEKKVLFPTRLFSSRAQDHWVYNKLPQYAVVTCPAPEPT
ncbi:oxysterol-binding protein-related protein 11-like isoform X2 [Oratosquilla oratoria]|uniref:oxysterol-binding protein-related protein 11-like isoform X2 n=1 Tax=Oratosquilla oratoria TaxID=337810 RepID=UPI003F7648EE